MRNKDGNNALSYAMGEKDGNFDIIRILQQKMPSVAEKEVKSILGLTGRKGATATAKSAGKIALKVGTIVGAYYVAPLAFPYMVSGHNM